MEFVIQAIGFVSIVILACGSDCDFNLITGPYGVSDDAFSASSTHGSCPLAEARINSTNGWCPAVDNENGHYIQVEFQTVSALRTILTRGRKSYKQWVTLYSVNTSLDGVTWSPILNSTTGDIQVFPGNFDHSTIVSNDLEENVEAKYIRVIGVSGNEDKKRSMRLEVQGCPVSSLPSSCQSCKSWKVIQGSIGDVLKVLEDTVASNQGICGLKCVRQSECDSFFFDVGLSHCRLLNSIPDVSSPSVNLDGIWYFIKNNSTDVS